LLGRREDALAMLRRYAPLDQSGAEMGAIDVALYEGRFNDASLQLVTAIASQGEAGDSAASAYLAAARLRQGDLGGATHAAEAALRADDPRLDVMGGLVAIDAGHADRVAAAVSRLASSPLAEERAAGKMLAAETMRVQKRPRDAVAAYEESLRLFDWWLGHYGLGLSYLDAGAFAEAHAELKTCWARRGQAAAYWLPSAHLVPPVLYYLARAEEGMGTPEAWKTYALFLDIEPDDQGDLLAADTRRRLERLDGH
jgi:tetratricopeptide (TPR) repeat protein